MNVVVEHGLRKVPAYYYTNKIYSKERWFKRTVMDVVSTEFSAHLSENVSIHKAKSKLVLTDDEALQSVIENGDVLEYTTHFHEPSIVDFGPAIEVVHDGRDLIVVNKPSGVPTHPSGKYRLNSLTEILSDQLGYPVFPAHRLDRLTSGVVVMGKSKQATSQFRKDLAGENVYKEYYAKVTGRFPSDVLFEFPLFEIDANRDFGMFLRAFSTRKPAKTRLKLIDYDSTDDSSIVSCVPITGRTHQIRKHLAIMGHAIVNDSLYKRPVFREISLLLEKNAVTSELEEAYSRLQHATRQSRLDKLDNSTGSEVCSECNVRLFRDTPPEEMMIYLHAKQYVCKVNGDTKWNYETSLPSWASSE